MGKRVEGAKHACDFFVLRTPLLPFDSVFEGRPGEVLRRVRELLKLPEVREAIYLGSPGLFERMSSNPDDPDRLAAAARYVLRAAARSTPFGLFAGCSTGEVGDETRLSLASRGNYRRRSRLDMDYLVRLKEALVADSKVRESLRFFPNTSLYRAAGRLRYAEERVDGNGRAYELVAVEEADHLLRTIERARAGAYPRDLAQALVGDDADVTTEEATAYVEALIEAQILVPELTLPVTGPGATEEFVRVLRTAAGTKPIVDVLERVTAKLAEVDARPLGGPVTTYEEIATELESLPAEVERRRLIQVDMMKPAPRLSLSRDVVDRVERGVDLLRRIAPPDREDELTRFVRAFRDRYDDREVPLVEVLDEESGVGFERSRTPSAEGSPLVAGLRFPLRDRPPATWTDRDRYLLRRLSNAEVPAAGPWELELTDEDIRRLERDDHEPLPDAFSATIALGEGEGEDDLFIQSFHGPSGARLLGRFCYLDETLERHVAEHLRREEALRPDAIFAEITHLPEGRSGNVLFRPLLRQHEIPFLGSGAADEEHRIDVADLTVSVVGERVVLRSKRLEREIVPRLSTAHRFVGGRIGLYRFLCTLQSQRVTGSGAWRWGVAGSLPRLPRVRRGDVVFSKQTWSVTVDELADAEAVARWRRENGAPRLVEFAEGDNVLTTDLDDPDSIDILVRLVKRRGVVSLREVFPLPGRSPVSGPEGRFAHEIILPFVKEPSDASPTTRPPRRSAPAVRGHPPGSEWLYVKLYAGTASVDRLLESVARPLTDRALRSGAARQWFFIRYGDPDWHLRLRLRGDATKLLGETVPHLHELTEAARSTGEIWRVQLDTYEPEFERYGGADAMPFVEELFHADSEAVLATLQRTGSDGDERWRAALAGLDLLLDDLGLSLEEKGEVADRVRDGFAREFDADTAFNRALSLRHRKARVDIDPFLEARANGRTPPASIEPFLERSESWAPSLRSIARLESAGHPGLRRGLAPSLMHMHVNRMLRSAQRAQELVLYDYLSREYRSRIARRRKADADRGA